MRLALALLAGVLAAAQTPDPIYEQLARAYETLRSRDYDTAIAGLRNALELAPGRILIRKDLAYTYLKIGENELAREQFQEALRLAPDDTQVALEYAFLSYETGRQAEARRVFDRLRKAGNAAAEQAFQNIDIPLAEGIERWRQAIEQSADSFSDHFELATLAEQRDELALAAKHYERAWRILPDRRSVLVALGRVWKQLDRLDEANAALLAASRGGEPRAAEMARELLPARYPFVPEFRFALRLDPGNTELRRELGFLLLRMGRLADAELEFRVLTETAPEDLLSATQLGFLLYARGENAAAQLLFDRVLAGNNEDLANRVRAVLRLEQVLTHADAPPEVVDARLMAERSINAGYLRDAAKYLLIAHEAEPSDFSLMLKLGWTCNLLRRDTEAAHWFEQARHSPDPRVASEASRGWRNLRAGAARFRTTAWFYPVFSSRWRDLFSYSQLKTEVRTGLPLRPYVTLRFIGDTRQTIAGGVSPQYLSESSLVVGVGLATVPWHGLMLWGEAGSAMNYLSGHKLPDYRGGLVFSRSWGTTLAREGSGPFVATTADAVFLSRFGNDSLIYSQTRAGYMVGPPRARLEFHWNLNATVDSQRQYWANFVELGPGIRFYVSPLPQGMFFSVDALSGAYLVRDAAQPPHFRDVRAGVWYALSR